MQIAPLRGWGETRTFVFSFDEKYARFFSVTLMSLVEHARETLLGAGEKADLCYDVVVLHDSVTDETKEALSDIVTDTDGFELRFFDVGDYAREVLGDLAPKVGSTQWDVSTFYDLLVPLLMPRYERVLYCDSDILFRADPSDIFKTPLDGRELAAVRDSLRIAAVTDHQNPFIQNQVRVVRQDLGIGDLGGYFNGGILLFDITAIDRDDYLRRVREGLRLPELVTADQDVLNHVFRGRTRLVSQRFNLQAHLLGEVRGTGLLDPAIEEYLKAAEDPVVIHYTTRKKPWLERDCPFAGSFWEYAARSPFKEEIVNAGKRPRRGPISLAKGAARRALKLPAKAKTFVSAAPSRAHGSTVAPVSCVQAGGGEVIFSHESGAYNKRRLHVEMTAQDGRTIAYTTDGSEPTLADCCGKAGEKVALGVGRGNGAKSLASHADLMMIPDTGRPNIQESPRLPSGRVLRAASMGASGEMGKTATRTYLLGTDFSRRFPGCLVVSVVTDPSNLLDYETGILATGIHYDEWVRSEEAKDVLSKGQFWLYQTNSTQRGKKWERPCHVQVFGNDGTLLASQDAGMRVAGNASRGSNQKSFNIYFRRRYGSKYLDCELIEGIDRYRSFRLSAGGGNTEWLKFKNAFLQDMVAERCMTTLRSQPAVLFLNGEYWGPYMLTEKLSGQMFSSRYGVDPKQVVIIKEQQVEAGKDEDIHLFEELMSFAEKDLADQATWNRFCGVMDVRSMADLCAAKIYIGDADWLPDKNDVLWRTRDDSHDGGRWSYVLYDNDNSSGMYGNELTAPETDHFHQAVENHPLFAAAIKNREFLGLFLDSLREIGSVCFGRERFKAALGEYLSAWKPLMGDCYQRFGNTSNLWNASLSTMTDFFERRYDHIVPIVEAEALKA